MSSTVADRLSLSILLLIITFAFTSSSTFAGGLRTNGKIAFTSDRDGNREIYVMNPDGSDQTRLTNNNVIDDHPSWSPDGRKIAFISRRATTGHAIFQMNADGTGKTEITPIVFQDGQSYVDAWRIGWSPNATELVFSDVDGGVAFVSIVKADGTGRRMIASGHGSSWSPDGTQILFIGGSPFKSELKTIKPDGTGLHTLPPLPEFYSWYYDASWSPTSEKLAITAFDGANEIIFLANADGTEPREFHSQCVDSPEGCSRLAAASWSPDGNSLVYFTAGFISGMEINTVDIADGSHRRLTDTTGNNWNPSWQPLSATVSVSGRVKRPGGQGLANAVVSITGPLGFIRTATTSTFGYYSFENIPAGESYTLSVASRRYRFQPRTLLINDNLTDIDFIGQE